MSENPRADFSTSEWWRNKGESEMYTTLDKARMNLGNLTVANKGQDRYKITTPGNIHINDFIKQSGQEIWLIWDTELNCGVKDTETEVIKSVYYNSGIQTSFRTWLIQVAGILNRSNYYTHSNFMVIHEEMYNYEKDDYGDYELREICGTELSVFLMDIGLWPLFRELEKI